MLFTKYELFDFTTVYITLLKDLILYQNRYFFMNSDAKTKNCKYLYILKSRYKLFRKNFSDKTGEAVGKSWY